MPVVYFPMGQINNMAALVPKMFCADAHVCHSASISQIIRLKEKVFLVKIALKFVPKYSTDNGAGLIQVKARWLNTWQHGIT